MLRLIKPALKYKDSYLRAIKRMHKIGTAHGLIYPLKPDLASQLSGWTKESKNKHSERYWLVEGQNYLGTLIIRYKLTGPTRNIASHIHYSTNPYFRRKGYGTKILALGLKEAKKLGFAKVFITCLDSNTPSKKIIEKNGGQFIRQQTIQGERELLNILKYKISC